MHLFLIRVLFSWIGICSFDHYKSDLVSKRVLREEPYENVELRLLDYAKHTAFP